MSGFKTIQEMFDFLQKHIRRKKHFSGKMKVQKKLLPMENFMK